jgi:hypothetical protein
LRENKNILQELEQKIRDQAAKVDILDIEVEKEEKAEKGVPQGVEVG